MATTPAMIAAHLTTLSKLFILLRLSLIVGESVLFVTIKYKNFYYRVSKINIVRKI
jgi:hypothetical protein